MENKIDFQEMQEQLRGSGKPQEKLQMMFKAVGKRIGEFSWGVPQDFSQIIYDTIPVVANKKSLCEASVSSSGASSRSGLIKKPLGDSSLSRGNKSPGANVLKTLDIFKLQEQMINWVMSQGHLGVSRYDMYEKLLSAFSEAVDTFDKYFRTNEKSLKSFYQKPIQDISMEDIEQMVSEAFSKIDLSPTTERGLISIPEVPKDERSIGELIDLTNVNTHRSSDES